MAICVHEAAANFDSKKNYQLGGRVIITSQAIDAEYAKIEDKKNISRAMVAKQMIRIRSVVLALKLAKQIPDDHKNQEMNTYEVDKMIYAQFVQMVNNNTSVTLYEISKMQDFYSNMSGSKLYRLREIVVTKQHAKNLEIYQDMVHCAANKTNEFASLAKKHSIARCSAELGGAIGDYNLAYDSAISNHINSMKHTIKSGDMFIIKEDARVALYYVQEIFDYTNPDYQTMRTMIENEKMNGYVAMLFANYPVDVVEA